MKKLLTLMLALLLTIPVTSFAAPSVEELQQKIAEITAQLQMLSQKVDAKTAPAAVSNSAIDELRAQIAAISEELEYMSERVDETETHSALDRITFTGDFRTKVDSLHYNDVTWNPGIMVNYPQFFMDTAMGNFGTIYNPSNTPENPLSDLQAGLSGYYDGLNQVLLGNMTLGDLQSQAMDPTTGLPALLGPGTEAFAGFLSQMLSMPASQQAIIIGNMLSGKAASFPMYVPKTYKVNNDVLYTTRFRLGMKAKISDDINFAGRLLMYKNWGDSTTSKVFDSWNAFTMDGTSSGNTSGDWLRVERAYFDWKDIGGTPFYLSVGRRPSTYGNPTNYRENEMRGGTPSGHLVDFNFDGITIGYHMSELTGIEGQTVRFCYGQGFESELGNGELFNNLDHLKDTQLGGFNIDVFNDGQTFISATLFRAQDVVDGFKGTFAFPDEFVDLFTTYISEDTEMFPNMNFVTRYTPSTTIGDMDLAGLSISREEDNGINWFASLGWTRLEPNGDAGMFGGMGTDQMWEIVVLDNGTPEDTSDDTMLPLPTGKAENDDTQDGYGVYVGLQVPAPYGKFGLEYNYGSRYWTPFTQAQDDMLGSKLATRGHVGEAYYIFEINSNFFIKVGGLYYKYEYTGSGSPVGKPISIDDIKSGKVTSMLPVVDSAWDAYAQFSMRF